MRLRSFSYHPMRRLASGRAGVAVAALWGVAEALWWPVVPDVFVFSGSVAAPRSWWKLALTASAGSVAGGLVAYWIASRGRGPVPIDALPLVGPKMVAAAQSWLAADGARAVMRQPLSGIPYKVFAYLSGDAGIGLGGFVLFSAIARSLRIVFFAGVAAGIGAFGGERVWSRWYDLFIGTLLVLFAIGLIGVVNRF